MASVHPRRSLTSIRDWQRFLKEKLHTCVSCISGEMQVYFAQGEISLSVTAPSWNNLSFRNSTCPGLSCNSSLSKWMAICWIPPVVCQGSASGRLSSITVNHATSVKSSPVSVERNVDAYCRMVSGEFAALPACTVLQCTSFYCMGVR